ncbi:PAS domain-containing protein, partial [bacterium]|nr:PAS domain-containing protein [bacterium]
SKRFFAPHARPELQAIMLAVFACIFAWVMQAALDFYFYAGKTYPEHLLLSVPPRELYSRVTIIAAFLAAGFISSRMVRRLEVTTARAERLDSVVRSVRAVNQHITRETDRRVLARKSCETLVRGLGYRRVEIRLDGALIGGADLNDGPPATDDAAEPGVMTVPLECRGRVFGELRVMPDADLVWDEEERALLREVADDVAYARRGIETVENLEHQRVELQTILDSVPAYVSYKDRDGRYLRVSRATADLAGIPAEEWRGKRLPELVPGASDSGQALDSEVIATGQPRRTALGRLAIAPEERWVQTDRIPYRDGSGDIIGVIAFSVDITELMETQRDLAIKDEQLRQSQKMEAIGLLAGGIAHDFNNLLTAISGYTELALSRLGEDEPVASMLGSVIDASGKAAALTQQLLAFSRKQPLMLASQDLSAIVKNMGEIVGCLVGEDIRVRTCLAVDLGHVEVDASQIEQVILNLAVNARDAMPEGGKLSITTERASSDEEELPEECSERSGSYVCLSISDTGTGMDQETMDHIFEPFFTTKEKGVGTGLGLSVVFGIVQQHGGRIQTDTVPGRGTTFNIYLPVIPEPEPAPGPERDPALGTASDTPAVGAGGRILLVEDEEVVRGFAADTLRHYGYEIIDVGSAEEAIVALSNDSAGFDMVFSDIVLPGKSGIELAEEIMARDPNARLLLASGYPDRRADTSHPQQMGIPFLSKPYTIRGLLESVRNVLC